jgi:hypothetical protein
MEDHMIEIEDNLRRALEILGAQTANNPAARKTAVRWFNRLYYDLYNWNDEFVQFLRAYPGFKERPLVPEELEEYQQKFYAYAKQLDSGGRLNESGNDICSRIQFLEVRIDKDFAWLKEQDTEAFWELKEAVGRVESFPGGFQGISSHIFQTVRRLEYYLFGTYDYHTKLHDRPSVASAREAVEKYVSESRQILQKIWDESRRVGLLLLSVTEYDEALRLEGSINPNLFVIGEVAMSQETYNVDNRGGIFNVKSTLTNVTQIISGSSSLQEDERQTFNDLVKELQAALTSLAEQRPAEAERIADQVQSVAKEVARDKPDKGYLKITAEGLKHAAGAVAGIAPVVLQVAEKIIGFVSKYL